MIYYTKGSRHFINKNDRTKKSLIGHPGINKASSSRLDIEKQFSVQENYYQ